MEPVACLLLNINIMKVQKKATSEWHYEGHFHTANLDCKLLYFLLIVTTDTRLSSIQKNVIIYQN